MRGCLIASFVGLLLCIQYVALIIWTGPIANALGGVDVSVIAPALVGIGLYWLLDRTARK